MDQALTAAERAACGDDPGGLCLLVYRATENDVLATGAELLLAKPLRILLILVIALVLRALLHRFIARLVARTATAGIPSRLRDRAPGVLDGSPMASERRRQRAETVGSVLRSLASFAIFAVAFTLVLGELGVNLAPIIASAGIVGVAVGFGAQNLVRDFLSGIFMMLEDQYGVGDSIDAGEATGVVEAISLRTTRLRDVNGTVWHIRNGEILRVGNMSQNWSRALVDITVAYNADVDRAREVIKGVADALWRDPAYEALVLEEPEVWGVERMGSDGVAIRLVVKTAPTEQWAIARELRQRVKVAFEAEGIAVPLPVNTMVVAGDASGAKPAPVAAGPAAKAPARSTAKAPAKTARARKAPAKRSPR